MAYRDDAEPLKERRDQLSKELEEVRTQSRALADEERTLSAELDRVTAHLEGAPRRRTRLVLAAVAGAASCTLLCIAGIARIMTSEIAPFAIESSAQAQTDVHVAVAASTPESPADSTTDVDFGTVSIDGPARARIYDGDLLLGYAPLLVPLSHGLHTIRMVPEVGPPHTKLVYVREHGVTVSHFN